MKTVHSYFFCILMFLIMAVLFSPTPDCFAETCDQWVAQVVSVQGHVEVRTKGETVWQPVKPQDVYCRGDMIRVMEKSRAAVVLVNGVLLRLDQNSTLTFNGIEKEQTSLIELFKGVAHFFSRWTRALKVATPFVNGTVEGTEFLVRVEDDRTFMSIFEGQVLAVNDAGSLILSSGESAQAEEGKAPVAVSVVRPRDAVQWALYYPQIISDKAQDSASRLLRVGRVDEASEEIDRVLKTDPDNSNGLALQSIIAVVQNDKERALRLANEAVESDLNSAVALLALSYAQQAHFDIEGALNSLKKAVEVDPDNAIVWARLSEMWLYSGDLDEALKTAKRAVELNPNTGHTQTVLGFAYLTQIKTGKSKETFEKAIGLDQAAPLPRLGLGLAKIREGNLKEGRREIEVAVSLDPDNSLIRSYLGKAYYEEKIDKFAKDQYSMAKDFDPKDPTPFFYDAIRKQSVNRPVEAMHDMRQAIELNDDRAVYRSKLLLDSDLAARSASLARIHSDLGFEQLALVNGWKSVNTDPGNYSAHRFLADSYAVLPRHGIARVSELLQSQLLQPINITPVQPHLAESNLFILDGAGPADASFNEFNPLFNRDRFTLQVSGLAGGDDTFGDEIVVAGVHKKFSFSVGQFHYETDGWRENNDQEQDIYNIFAQLSLSHRTSIQAEFRSKDIDQGDSTLNFFQDYWPNLRLEDDTKTLRIGLHHAFSPSSDLLCSVFYKDAEYTINDTSMDSSFDAQTDEEGYSGELQYLFRSKYFNVVGGAGHFDVDSDDTVTYKIIEPPIKMVDVDEDDIDHTNLYLYSNIHFLKNLTVTAGGSADFFDSETIDEDQFNPKLGLTWNMFPDTTLRAAVFRTLKRMLINDQTLEPTQVAGFNQFFDDANGTESWRYGVAIDQEISKNIYGGVEYSMRDLDVPYQFVPTPSEPPPSGPPPSGPPPSEPPPQPLVEFREVDWKEYLGRVYLYWTPYRWLSFSAEYQYEKFDRDKEFVAGIEEVKTHRFPLGINFSHPSGISARLQATYYDQEGKFLPLHLPPGSSSIKGSDTFWVVDASISYRLPKRYGVITIGAKNLFDESFNYQDTDPASPLIQPEQFIFARFTLAL